VEAVAGPDGSFVVPGLCKGNYTLEVSAPGLATVERPALIEPARKDAAIRVVLGQGDALSGRILDEAGKPIAGAAAQIAERQLPHPDGTRTSFNGFLEMKTTDADGRFRFQGVPEGDYTLKLSADGFTAETRKNVPAGAENLDIVLKRARPR
jgi:hypothetical protein